ncbi:hypothetical protein D9M70_564120 [compost metagenome]
MYAQLVIHNVQFAIAHAAGAYRVEDGGADLAGGFEQLLFGLQGWARQVFLWVERSEGRGLDDTPGKANGIGGDAQVLGVAEVVWVDQRCAVHVAAADIDTPAAGRAQVAHRGGEGRKVMQRLAETLQ